MAAFSGTPARIMFLTADRRRSWNRRFPTPARLQAERHAFWKIARWSAVVKEHAVTLREFRIADIPLHCEPFLHLAVDGKRPSLSVFCFPWIESDSAMSEVHLVPSQFASVQILPDSAPVNMAQLKVTRATPDGGRETFNITRPMRDVIENFSDVLLKGVGEDAEFEKTDPYHKLLLICLSADTQYAPEYDTATFVEGGKWYYAGDAKVGKPAVALAANAEVEIVREIKRTSRRAKRLFDVVPSGSGYEFWTVSREALQAGQFPFPGRAQIALVRSLPPKHESRSNPSRTNSPRVCGIFSKWPFYLRYTKRPSRTF